MNQKFLDLAGLTAYDKMLKEWFKNGVVDITEDAIRALFVTVAGPADNEIWYTTVDGTVLNPEIYVDDTFGANIVSNTYENGKGVITFDSNITDIPMHSFQSNNLASIYLPNSLTSISTQAFRGSKIVSITIPRNVTQIGGHAFVECFDLENIKYNGTMSEWNDIMANIHYSPFGAIGYRVPANVVNCIDGDVDLIFDESMPF